MALTSRQTEVLRFIQSFINKNSFSPSLSEIGDGVGIKSNNAVDRHLKILQIQGYITKEPLISRSIVILKPLEEDADNKQDTSNDST